MRAVTLPVLVTYVCLCLSCSGVGAYEVLMWLHAECGCSYAVNEQTESLEVCAEILFINGTATTISDYDVTMSTIEGSATSGVDYGPLSSLLLTFPEGSSQGDQQCTTISITDDIAVESTESFRVELASSDAEVEFSSICPSAPISITDNDVITVEVTEQTMTTNHTEPPGGFAEVCLNITHGILERTVAATYTTQAGTATDSRFIFPDYIYASTSVSFASGLSAGDIVCISVFVFDDSTVEDDEHFFVVFGSGSGVTVNSAANSATITILDDEVAVIGMSVPSISQIEDDVEVSVCIMLVLSQRLETTVTGFVRTEDITATGDTSGSDYNEILFRLIALSAGSGGEQCTSFRINEDTILEYNETFQVVLMEDLPKLEIEPGRETTEITIVEDEDDISIGFQSLVFSSTEGISATATVCTQIDEGALERNVSFFLTTMNLTATGDSDYVSRTSQELAFLSGQSSSIMPTSCTDLEILNDDILEDQEAFSVIVTSQMTAVVITSGREQAQVLIDEDSNDSVTIGFPLGQTLNVTEGNEGTIAVCPEILQGVLERDVSVFASTSDITATASSDYTALVSEEIIFTAGQVTGDTQCISVSVLDDVNVLEVPVETFEVALTAVDSGVVFIVGQENITVNIIEDTMDGVTIGLQGTFYATDETAGPASVCAEMFNGNLEREVSMTLVSSDGTAVAPGDYEALNTQLVFSVGTSTGAVVCTDLQVTDDNVVEEDEETLTLTMSADDPPVTTTTTLVATVSIRENDNDVAGSVALTSAIYDAFESNGGVDVCVTINATALERSLTVLLSSQDGTARNVADYTAFQFVPFTFSNGAQAGDEQCHFTPVVDDDILEDSESFFVTLLSTEPAFLGSSSTQATVTINPDPADVVELAFQSDVFSGTEQLSLRDVTICVDIVMGILERDVIVNVETTNGTAENGIDYTGPTPSVVTFGAGLRTGDQHCIVVSVVDDDFIEDEEAFDIILTVPPADVGSVIFNGTDVTTFTIIQDPNDRAIVQLQQERVNGMEGQNISVCTVLSSIAGEVQRPLLINVTATSASADIGVDFDVSGPAAVIFPPNSVAGDVECITIELLTDRFLEVPENFVTNLNTNDPAVTVDLAADLTIITIIDVPDPNAVGVTFTALDFNITEGDPFVEVCVEIVTGTVNEEDTVDVETMSGTATADSDFATLIGSVRFFPGETVGAFGCVNIAIDDDDIVEDDEIFTVSLSSTGTLQAIGNTTANVTIFQDSDFVLLGLQASDLTIMENETFLVCVEITDGSLERDVFIGLAAVNSSNAQEGVAFIGPDPSILTFTAGQTVGDIQCSQVTILDNSVFNGERNFSIQLVEVSGGGDGDDGGGDGGGGDGDGGGDSGGGGGAQIDPNVPSIDIRIALDLPDVILVRLSQLMYQVTEGPLLGPAAEAMVCATIQLGSLGRDVSVNLVTPVTGPTVIATPILDFTPIAETVTFTEGQSAGDSVCAGITIVSDFFLETAETFEVLLLPNPEDLLAAIIVSGMDRAIITILDNQEEIDIPVRPSVPNVVTTEGTGSGGGGGSEVEVCIELAGENLQRNVTLNAKTVSSPTSTATVNEDYLDIDVNLTFVFGPNATGSNRECVLVPLLDDGILEGNETFDILITPSAEDEDVLNITDPVITVTIQEDSVDFVEVGLLPVNMTITENATFPVCVQLTNGILGRDIIIPLVVESGSAVEGVDFIGPEPPELTFTAGQSAGDIRCASVTILDDSIPQGERNFSISIGDGGGDGGGGGGGGVRVDPDLPSIEIDIAVDLDDVIFVRLSQLMYQVMEGPLLGPFAEATVCATINIGSASRDISVNLATPITGPTVIATPILDFTPIAETLTFTEGQSAGDSVCAGITIVSDFFVEREETFEVLLLPNPDDFFAVIIQPGMDRGVVIIADGEENSNVEVQPAVFSVLTTEGDGGSDFEEVETCLELASGNLQRNVTVNVKTMTSPTATATVVEDYLNLDVNITFTSGQNATGDNQQCFFITIPNDDILECNETFDIFISPIPEDEDVVNITRPVLTVFIEEDANDFVEIRLLPDEFSVSEGETFPVCAELSAGSVGCKVSISLDAQSGSAVEGVDFTGPDPPVLTFTPGQSVGDIQCTNITVVDDSLPQPERSIVVRLGNNRTVGGLERVSSVRVSTSVPSVSFDIDTDINDVLQVNFSQPVYEAVEGFNEVSICVVIQQGFTTSDTTVQVITTFGVTSTAIPILDFLPTLQVLTFTTGQSTDDTECATVTIIEDVLIEAVETFDVTLLPTTADLFKVLIISGQDKSIVAISDGASDNSVEITPSSSMVTAIEGVAPTGGLQKRSSGTGDDCVEVMVCLELVSGNLGRNVSVTVQTVSSPTSTAVVGVDYVSFERNITFTSGQNATGDNQQCVFIPLLDDDVLEGNQTFSVLITPAPGDEDVVVINSTNEMITVVIQEDPNDNIQIGLTNTRFTVTESVDSTIMLCAELQIGSIERNVSIAVMAEGSNATAGVDFIIEPEVLTFTSGQSAFDGLLQCANITILDDDDTEPRESLMIFLEAAEGDATAVVIPPIGFMSSITIIEDPSDEVQISPLTSVETVTEGGTATVCIGVSLGSLQTVVQVNVRTITSVASTATPGEDFSPFMETVTLDSNDPVCNSISILDDDILEGCEAFLIDIEVPAAFSGIAVVPNDVDKMIILIEDDLSDEIVVGFSQSAFMAFEVNGFVTVCVELLEGRLDRDVSVFLETVEGSATRGDDYIHIFSEVSFAAGAEPGTLACVNITIIDENEVERPETFSVVSLQSTPGVRFNSSRAISTVEIIDDGFNASQSDRAVAVAVPIVVVFIIVVVAIAVVIAAYFLLKSRKNKKEVAIVGAVAFQNVDTLESKAELPIVIDEDSKSEKPDETTAL